jgi:aspergillopepsin I
LSSWVLSDRLNAPLGAQPHAVYPTPMTGNGTHSRLGVAVTGTQMDGESFTIRYGDGTTASGLIFSDAVSLVSSSSSPSSPGMSTNAVNVDVTATAQAVGAATLVADKFWRQGNDGIVGMGFSSANTVKPVPQKTFWDNIRGSLKTPVFAAWLKHGGTGAYDFGWVDTKKYQVRHPLASLFPLWSSPILTW